MNLSTALTLPHNTIIPSIEVDVLACIHSQPTRKSNTVLSVYTIKNGQQTAELKFFTKQNPNLHPGPLRITSSSAGTELKGVKIELYKGETSILCDGDAQINPLKAAEPHLTALNAKRHHTPMTYPPLPQNNSQASTTVRNYETHPLSQDEIINYYGKLYLASRERMIQTGQSTQCDIDPQHAHEFALAVIDIIPKSWFGERKLPE